jgi:hypothetical protein
MSTNKQRNEVPKLTNEVCYFVTCVVLRVVAESRIVSTSNEPEKELQTALVDI